MKTFIEYRKELTEAVAEYFDLNEKFEGFDHTNRDHYTTAFDGTRSGSKHDGIGSQYHKLAAVQNSHNHPDGHEAGIDVLKKAIEQGNKYVRTVATNKLAKISAANPPAAPASSDEPKLAAEKPAKPAKAKKPDAAEAPQKKIPEPDYVPKDHDDEDDEDEKPSGRVAAADMGPPHVRFRGHLNSALDQEGSHANVTFHDGETHSIDKDHIKTVLSTVDAVKSPQMKQRLLDTARKGVDGFTAAHKAATAAISAAHDKAKEQLANKKKQVTGDFSSMDNGD